MTNILQPRGISTEKLFYSPAFVRGFRDARAGNPFRYPDGAPGPKPHIRSAQLAYERGRQFGVLWGRRPVTNLSKMKKALARFHSQRLIT